MNYFTERTAKLLCLAAIVTLCFSLGVTYYRLETTKDQVQQLRVKHEADQRKAEYCVAALRKEVQPDTDTSGRKIAGMKVAGFIPNLW